MDLWANVNLHPGLSINPGTLYINLPFSLPLKLCHSLSINS